MNQWVNVQAGRANTGSRIKVAAYIRVSTDSSDQENSYETQERYFSQLLDGHEGWISGGIYSDYGISGTSGRNRMGFRRILRHCREGRIDRIVCKSVSRFARNTGDFIEALRILEESRVTILFEKENLDTADPVNEFLLTALGAFAQEESRSISENVRWSFRKRYPRGEARNMGIYGYRFIEGEDGMLETAGKYRYRAVRVVAEEAEVVRRIFREAAEGVSYKDIARRLNQEGIAAPESGYTRKRREHAAKGQLKSELDEGWTARNISQILRLERYTGDVLLQKTYTVNYLTHEVRKNRGEMTRYLVRDHHPAIVDRSLFEKAQRIREMNARRYGRGPERNRRVFSGRLVCAHCGRFLHVRNTGRRPVWYCPSTVLHNGLDICHLETIPEEQVVRMLRKAAMQRFFPVLPEGAIGQMRSRLETLQKLDHMERDQAFLKKRGDRKGLMDLEEYREELEADYEKREAAIGWLKALTDPNIEILLRGMSYEYAGAFVLSITVISSESFRVHWFDDTRTELSVSAE